MGFFKKDKNTVGNKFIKEEAMLKLNKMSRLNGTEAIDFITNECIKWYLNEIPSQTSRSNLKDMWINGINTIITNIAIEKESLLSIFFWTRALEYYKLYSNKIGDKAKLVSYMHMDLNYVAHFAESKELIGLVSCIRKELNLSGYIELEYNISRIMLGNIFNNMEFKETWGWNNYSVNIIENIVPNYYYGWKYSGSLMTTGAPILSLHNGTDLKNIYNNSNSPFECCYNNLTQNGRIYIHDFADMYNSNDDLFYITKPEYWSL